MERKYYKSDEDDRIFDETTLTPSEVIKHLNSIKTHSITHCPELLPLLLEFKFKYEK